MTSFPLRATTAEVQLDSQEWEQLEPMLAFWEASTYIRPAMHRKNTVLSNNFFGHRHYMHAPYPAGSCLGLSSRI